jgi:AraC family transcriptional regulator
MELKVFERPARRVALRRYTGPYGTGVATFWRNQMAPWLRRENLLSRPRYGISHDDPLRTAPEQCRYDAGVEVHDSFVGDAGVELATIAAGRYASTAFRGTAAQLGAAWAALFHEGLTAHGLQPDETRPSFEYYRPDSAYDPTTGVFDCEIVVPVAPL